MLKTSSLGSRSSTPDEASPVPTEQVDFIGENLRKLFGAVEREPLPPRLTALLDSLSAAETVPDADSGDDVP